MKRISTILLLLPWLLFSCSEKADPALEQEVKTYKVAVILPSEEKAELSKIIDWAQDNIKAAQQGQQSRIELSLEWIDENSPSLSGEVTRVTHDESYAAIIGPRYSRDARLIARESLSYRMPVLMPSVTSTEFQRIYAGSNMTDPNIFCFAENDMAQCQAMLAKARASNYSRISLLSRDGKKDDYAASFQQFYAYLAREMDMYVEATYLYEDATEMEQGLILAQEAHNESPFPGVLIFVPSSRQDMLDFDSILGRHGDCEDMLIFCTDMAYDFALEGKLKNFNYEGTTLAARPGEGFDIAWHSKYGTDLPGGYAQLYDCFYMAAMAAAAVEEGKAPSVREAIVDIISSEKATTPIYSWTPAGMANAFKAVKNHDYELITGVSGPLQFEAQTKICQMNTVYNSWVYSKGKFMISGRFSRRYSGNEVWNWSSTQIQDDFDVDASEGVYPALKDNYAVVIATSTGWSNYRHQADALAQYQMLKGFGYDDDHIILIIEDDIAGHKDNPHPGKVHVTPDGPDLRAGAVIDYKTTNVTPEDLMNILAGHQTDRTPAVVKGSPNTNVFLFWSGHGARDNMLVWGEGPLDSKTFRSILEGAQGNYRKMLAVMETCYSGSVGKYCEGLPGILLLCAASSGETSHADVIEDGIYLSNRFTRVFRSEVEANPSISIHDLYYQLATHTTGSHACIFNDEMYGNVYTNTLREFMTISGI